jgi:hypothetical protein
MNQQPETNTPAEPIHNGKGHKCNLREYVELRSTGPVHVAQCDLCLLTTENSALPESFPLEKRHFAKLPVGTRITRDAGEFAAEQPGLEIHFWDQAAGQFVARAQLPPGNVSPEKPAKGKAKKD